MKLYCCLINPYVCVIAAPLVHSILCFIPLKFSLVLISVTCCECLSLIVELLIPILVSFENWLLRLFSLLYPVIFDSYKSLHIIGRKV